MRVIFLYCCCFFYCHVFSLPIIEVSKLTESNLVNLYNINAKKESRDYAIQYDTAVINQLKAQLLSVNNLIKSKLLNSGLFMVMDAQPTINAWQSESPNILSYLYNAPIISESQYLIQKNKKLSAKLTPRYVLIGWITSIDSWKRKEKIFNSDKISFLSGLDIWVKYRLVDSYSKQVTTEFTALGHYGLAKILPDLNKNINFAAEPIIEGAIDNLVNDILRAVSAEFSSYYLVN